MFYIDEYAIVDLSYLVHAVPVNPCEEHAHEDYLLGLLLHVGHQGYQVAHAYPTRALRDAAFEKICALIQQEQLEVEDE